MKKNIFFSVLLEISNSDANFSEVAYSTQII